MGVLGGEAEVGAAGGGSARGDDLRAEVLLAAVITETGSAAFQLNFLWGTLILPAYTRHVQLLRSLFC